MIATASFGAAALFAALTAIDWDAGRTFAAARSGVLAVIFAGITASLVVLP